MKYYFLLPHPILYTPPGYWQGSLEYTIACTKIFFPCYDPHNSNIAFYFHIFHFILHPHISNITLELLTGISHNDMRMMPFLLVNECSINMRDSQTALNRLQQRQTMGSKAKYTLKAHTTLDFTTCHGGTVIFSSPEEGRRSAVGVE